MIHKDFGRETSSLLCTIGEILKQAFKITSPEITARSPRLIQSSMVIDHALYLRSEPDLRVGLIRAIENRVAERKPPETTTLNP